MSQVFLDGCIRSSFLKLVLAACCSIATTANHSSLRAQEYSIFHFKAELQLELNSEKIAAFTRDNVIVDRNQLNQLTLPVTAIETHSIPGWQMLEVDSMDSDRDSLNNNLSQLVSKTDFDFVAPVFYDNFEGAFFPTRDILIRFDSKVALKQQRQILKEAKVGTVLDRDWAGMVGAYRIRSNADNGLVVMEQANSLALRPEVRWAEPDMVFSGRNELIPNDEFFDAAWGLHNVGQAGACQTSPGTIDMDMDVAEAWDITLGDPNILVLILDTGCQQDHPDINQVPGMDFTGENGDGGPVNQCDNHGTPVAGCVSSIVNNNIGAVGAAPECPSASARTFISSLTCNGSWNAKFSWGADALEWAEGIGVRVTNNSNFYGGTSSALEDKYEETRNNGMVHFASAGNFATGQVVYPANLPTVNAIAALDADGQLASFSSFGPGLAFSAPGVGIVSTDRTGGNGYNSIDYVCISGTSFASPYAAGVAALVLSINPELTAPDVEEILQDTSVNLGAPGYDTTFGWGFVNAHQAVLLANETSEVTTEPMMFTLAAGEPVSGNLNSILNSDGEFLCNHPIEPDPESAPMTIDFAGVLLNDSPSSLDFTIESFASTPGLEFTVSFWNFNTSSWDAVGSAPQPTDDNVSATFSGTPSDHVQPGTGIVMTRYEVQQVSPIFAFPWLDCVDQVFWTHNN